MRCIAAISCFLVMAAATPNRVEAGIAVSASPGSSTNTDSADFVGNKGPDRSSIRTIVYPRSGTHTREEEQLGYIDLLYERSELLAINLQLQTEVTSLLKRIEIDENRIEILSADIKELQERKSR